MNIDYQHVKAERNIYHWGYLKLMEKLVRLSREDEVKAINDELRQKLREARDKRNEDMRKVMESEG